ncbi:ATP-grasp domain-containing protein [Jeotgalibaca ciconiae]|uniref:ATP-grasp domain-containing protein n=1 Tax=Jeotgalibaca ciconiae TaxID=2496265 RepID=A0A3S9HC11_9LACT|nr:ATP-grasp domain-containing protein [Jeotgalibaca ciconiae]AZP04905.1 ATP-grasp domain-containing protein [Jeotgalibaca ciconiae]
MNILILSCGTRNKIVRYFKEELRGKGQVLATDCSELAPALYEADKHFIVPRMNEDNYLDTILDICKTNNVNAVLSLIDPELSLLAKNKEKFLEIGTLPLVSNYDVIEMCFDKYCFNEFLSNNDFNSIRSYVDKKEFFNDLRDGSISFPVFVKPVKGSASINISKVNTEEEINTLFDGHDNLMIQKFLDGVEYGADVYVDMISKKPVSIFIKEKIKMRAGETDKSKSVKDDELFAIIVELINIINPMGTIDIDIFKVKDRYYISEINPRFGGGYPHAYECGVNFPKMIVKNLYHQANESVIGQYEEDIYMMKFNDVKILK